MLLSRAIFVFLVAYLTLNPSIGAAAEKGKGSGGPPKLGLGVVLGTPTAITGKYWLEEDRALVVGLGYSFSNSAINIYSDYLIHYPRAFQNSAEPLLQQLSPYFGLGALFHSSKNPPRAKQVTYYNETVANLNVRIPLGIEWLTRRVRLGIFLEVAPGIFVIPDLSPSLQAGIGIRYFF